MVFAEKSIRSKGVLANISVPLSHFDIELVSASFVPFPFNLIREKSKRERRELHGFLTNEERGIWFYILDLEDSLTFGQSRDARRA